MPEELLLTKTNRAPKAHSVRQPGLTTAPTLIPRAQRTLLLVDSCPGNRNELRSIVDALGHTIREACTQDEALQILSSQQVDLVLADITKSGNDGLAFCTTLRCYHHTRSVPIVLVAAPEQASEEASAITAGADEFLVRPLMPVTVRARVQSLLRRTLSVDSGDDFAAALVALAQAVEARDPAIGHHCQRVSALCSTLGAALNLPSDDLVTLQRGAFLHDIGKIAVPDNILFKRGPLSADEWSVMQSHTICGERICSGMKSLSGVLPTIRSHHERWDGSGYPDRLRADEIPLMARIIQVADIYDALTTDRPYKAAFTPEFALQTLRNEAAAGWRDAQIVEAFSDIFSLIRTVDDHSTTSLVALSLALGESTTVQSAGRESSAYRPAPTPVPTISSR